MGFGSNGKTIICKEKAEVVSFDAYSGSGATFWKNRRIAIECNGLSHKVMAQLPAEYCTYLARHHHHGFGMDIDTMTWIANAFLRELCTQCSKYHLVFPSLWQHYSEDTRAKVKATIKMYKCVDIVAEHRYKPKANYDRYKAELRKEHLSSRKNTMGAVIPDCIMAIIFTKLQASGFHVTVPPAEFDATGAHRFATGWDTMVFSKDADIPLFPSGVLANTGRILFPDGNKLTVFDKNMKCEMIRTHFGAEPATDCEFYLYEVLLLFCALFCPHDYHYAHDASKALLYTNRTGIGIDGFQKIVKSIGTTARAHLHTFLTQNGLISESKTMPDRRIVPVFLDFILLHHEKHCEDALTAKRTNSGSSVCGRAKSAVLAFVNQNKSLVEGQGIYCGKNFVAFKYEGACSDTCMGLADQAYVYTLARHEIKWQTAMQAPRILYKDTMYHFQYNMHLFKGAQDGQYCAYTESAGTLLGRVAVVEASDFKYAQLEMKDDPLRRKELPDNHELILVQGKSPQSFGCKGKENEGRKGAFYYPLIILEVSTVDGVILQPGFGSSTCKDGILWYCCAACKSGDTLCRHIKSCLVSLSRVREEDWATNHNYDKYWQQCKAAPITEEPTRIAELQTANVYLSDCVPDANEAELSDMVAFKSPSETTTDPGTDKIITKGMKKKFQKALKKGGTGIIRKRASTNSDTIVSLQQRASKLADGIVPDYVALRKKHDEFKRHKKSEKWHVNFHRDCDFAADV
eukprot:m.197889 g.197889  ORF g.197889 m.197889 type:complete len:744 (-) comp18725_c0_seq10:143-2374(-)